MHFVGVNRTGLYWNPCEGHTDCVVENKNVIYTENKVIREYSINIKYEKQKQCFYVAIIIKCAHYSDLSWKCFYFRVDIPV